MDDVPVGTVLKGDASPIPRVVADASRNGGWIFTDKGSMRDTQFVVISVPDGSYSYGSTLAEKLFYAGHDDGMNEHRQIINPEVWDRRANWVRDNFVPRDTVVAIIDNDGDRWTPITDSDRFSGPYGLEETLSQIGAEFGISEKIYAGGFA